VTEGLDVDDAEAATKAARSLDAKRLADPTLRGHEAGELASRVAVYPGVRAALLEFQRRFARQPGGAILDGRDIGTAVCPEADVKIYVTASPEVRAERRTAELAAKGRSVEYPRILEEIRGRDLRDAGRRTAPLAQARDAVLLDTTALDAEAAFRAAVAIVDRARAAARA
jgi:cytidylate kinase